MEGVLEKQSLRATLPLSDNSSKEKKWDLR